MKRRETPKTGPKLAAKTARKTAPKRAAKPAPKRRLPAGHAAYLAALPDDQRSALEKLRRAITAAAPQAEEGFSWSMPAYKLGGRTLVCFAAFTKHCSFFPMSAAVLRAHAEDLEGYVTSKGTIRFDADKQLTAALVRKIVKSRIAEMKAKAR